MEVIIKPSHGVFEPKEEFAKLITKRGYNSVFNIKARTDQVLIDYVKTNGTWAGDYNILTGKEYWTYIKVVDVDISKPWYIGEYDGAEYVSYLDYEIIDEDLNYIKLN